MQAATDQQVNGDARDVTTDSLGFVICPLCGCACGLNLLAQRVRADQPLSITVLPSSAPGWGASGLCMRGWQVGEILGSRRRLRHPLAWRQGAQERVGWDEALEQAGEAIRRLRAADPTSIGIVVSDSLSVEEVFAARQFADLLGTPNVASLGLEIDAPAIHGLEQVLGAPYRAPTAEELDGVDLFVCINSNYQHMHPRAAGAMARRVEQGAARMVLIDEVDQGLAVWATVFAQHPPGMRADAIRQLVAALSGEKGAGPLASADLRALTQAIGESRRVALVFSAGALGGIEEALAVGRLAQAMRAETRWVGAYALPSGANTFGTLDMLAAGGRGPGGMSATRMVAPGSGLRGLILVGEDLGRLYGPAELAELRKRLEFGMVLSSFVSSATELADLALPVAMSGEREGSIRRPGGRLSWSEQVVEAAGESLRITVALDALAATLGEHRQWGDNAATWAAIRAEVGGYRHVQPGELRGGALVPIGLDSASVADVVDARILTAAHHAPPQVSEQYPFVLLPRSSRGGWITDARCQGAHILRREATMYREPYVIMAQDDARRLGLRPGAWVQVTTDHGAVTVRMRSERGVPPGIVVLPTEYPAMLRALAEATETEALPLHPIAGSVTPTETR